MTSLKTIPEPDVFEYKLMQIDAFYLQNDVITHVSNSKSRSQQCGFPGTLIITHHRLLWLFGSQGKYLDLEQPDFV